MGFLPVFPSLVELEVLNRSCKKQNLQFKSTTFFEGSCTQANYFGVCEKQTSCAFKGRL